MQFCFDGYSTGGTHLNQFSSKRLEAMSLPVYTFQFDYSIQANTVTFIGL